MTDAAAVHAERTYALCLRFFAELAALGVRHVVASPGSRSTPLVVAAAASPLEVTMRIDERVAAFTALGIAKATGVPAVLIATSGTAVANQLPAVVEAHHAGVPMIVASANRPPELRGAGAGQTIDQTRIFGSATRWFHEVPVASEVDESVGRSLALRSFTVAVGERGPVHLDWPFRKPLDPTGPLQAPPATLTPRAPRRRAASVELHDLATTIERGLVLAGPLDADPATLAEIARFGADHGWPIVADPASGLRGDVGVPQAPVIATADLLAAVDGLDDLFRPDAVVVVGVSATSAAIARRLDAHRDARRVLVDPGADWPDPDGLADTVVDGPLSGCFGPAPDGRGPTEWTRRWLAAEAAAATVTTSLAATTVTTVSPATTASDRGGDTGTPDELRVVAAIAASLGIADRPVEVLVSSSMPIRDVDAVWPRSAAPVRLRSNRGANGIDGVIATASGIAKGSGVPTVVLVGDTAFVHDLGGLAALAVERPDVVVVVLDNDGGGIFSMLPVRRAVDAETFEKLFTVHHGTDPVAVATSLGIDACWSDAADVGTAIGRAIDAGGPALVAVRIGDGDVTVAATADLRRRVADAVATR